MINLYIGKAFAIAIICCLVVATAVLLVDLYIALGYRRKSKKIKGLFKETNESE